MYTRVNIWHKVFYYNHWNKEIIIDQLIFIYFFKEIKTIEY